MKQYQYATLKKVVAEADDMDATLKILGEAGVVSRKDARSIRADAETAELLVVMPTFDEIIAALEDEGCHNVAKELHSILTADVSEAPGLLDEAATDDDAQAEDEPGDDA